MEGLEEGEEVGGGDFVVHTSTGQTQTLSLGTSITGGQPQVRCSWTYSIL